VKWRIGLSLVTAALGAMVSLFPVAAAAPGDIVVIPIHGTIDEGMAHLVDRAVTGAEATHAQAVVIDVDTFGGLVSAATEIRDKLLAAPMPVYAYVSGRAWSAGALVTLAANHIAMAPASSIGAAEPIPKTIKTVSALRGEFAATAAVRHRNATLATAMVDATVAAPPYKAKGAILTLTADQAVASHFADSIAPNRNAALARWHLDVARVVTPGYSLGERLVRFATDPTVSGLLLAIGFVGLLIEMQTLHLIAGLIGATALALFFGSHVYAGFSDNLVVGLAVAGVLGILLELHVLPGHGVSGIVGVLALISAIVLAFGVPYFYVAAQSISIAIVLSVLLFWIAARLFPQNAFMRRIAFTGVQGRDYVAAPDQTSLIGHAGFATSFLRPAGVAAIDGKRVDVLTEGDFVAAGSPVVVTRVEGARIFVRPGV
jgi:membrane-bound serine protease (ClpP class)